MARPSVPGAFHVEAKHKPPRTAGIWDPQATIMGGVCPGPGRGSGLRGSPARASGRPSLADVALHRALAAAARDVAAPVILAVAALDHAVRVGVVASAAAHEVTAVTAVGRLVALPGGWGGKGRSGSARAHRGPAASRYPGLPAQHL